MIFIKEPSAEWLNYQLTPIKGPAALVLTLLISTAGGRFHFITVQGRHLFKETTFTVSTLPRAWLEPRANRMLVMKALRQIISVGRVTTVPGRRDLSLPSPCRTTGSQGSWDCTIVRPTEDLLLFPQDKESPGSITSHEENRFVFSRSRRLPFQSTR